MPADRQQSEGGLLPVLPNAAYFYFAISKRKAIDQDPYVFSLEWDDGTPVLQISPDDSSITKTKLPFAAAMRSVYIAGLLGRVERVFIYQGQPYLVTDRYWGGQTLDVMPPEVINAISLKTRLEYAVNIASQLAILHQHDLVHGDIRPENILVSAHSAQLVNLVCVRLQGEERDVDTIHAREFLNDEYYLKVAMHQHAPIVLDKKTDMHALALTLAFLFPDLLKPEFVNTTVPFQNEGIFFCISRVAVKLQWGEAYSEHRELAEYIFSLTGTRECKPESVDVIVKKLLEIGMTDYALEMQVPISSDVENDKAGTRKALQQMEAEAREVSERTRAFNALERQFYQDIRTPGYVLTLYDLHNDQRRQMLAALPDAGLIKQINRMISKATHYCTDVDLADFWLKMSKHATNANYDVNELSALVRFANFKGFHQFVSGLILTFFPMIKASDQAILSLFGAIDVCRREQVLVRCLGLKEILSDSSIMHFLALLPVESARSLLFKYFVVLKTNNDPYYYFVIVKQWLTRKNVTINDFSDTKMVRYFCYLPLQYVNLILTELEKILKTKHDYASAAMLYLAIHSRMYLPFKRKFVVRCLTRMLTSRFDCTEASIEAWWNSANMSVSEKPLNAHEAIFAASCADARGFYHFADRLVSGYCGRMEKDADLAAALMSIIKEDRREHFYNRYIRKLKLLRDVVCKIAGLLPFSGRFQVLFEYNPWVENRIWKIESCCAVVETIDQLAALVRFGQEPKYQLQIIALFHYHANLLAANNHFIRILAAIDPGRRIEFFVTHGFSQFVTQANLAALVHELPPVSSENIAELVALFPPAVRMQFVLDHMEAADQAPIYQLWQRLQMHEYKFLSARLTIIALLDRFLEDKIHLQADRVIRVRDRVRLARSADDLCYLLKAYHDPTRQIVPPSETDALLKRPPSLLFFSYGFNAVMKKCERIADKLMDELMCEDQSLQDDGWQLIRHP